MVEEAAERESASTLPNFRDTPSLILNRDHPLSDLYYKKAPYKIFWGGRGSAKSWGFAEAVIRIMAERNCRVLCAREFQNSIKESVYELLKLTAERLGLSSWFDFTADRITARSGAVCFFRGLHNNENGLRSLEAIDICWVEEGHSVSAASWRTLIPTIRKEGSEIWVSFNMNEESDATFQRFVKNINQQPWTPGSGIGPLENPPRTGAIVWKLNYDSNPYFGGKLKMDMEDDLRDDIHLYEHVWLGMPLKISDAIILSGKYTIQTFDDELWRKSDRVLLGEDFGFANDPAAIIRSFMLEEPSKKVPGRIATNLYIEYEAYGHKIELDDLRTFHDRIPDVTQWPIKADSARPETISKLRREGLTISAAEKWQGSVEDGIAHLKGFEQIIIHPRCVNTAREARLYRYKTDPKAVDEKGQPLVLPIIVDKHNHTWDAVRYSLDGYIQRGGVAGIWSKLGRTRSE